MARGSNEECVMNASSGVAPSIKVANSGSLLLCSAKIHCFVLQFEVEHRIQNTDLSGSCGTALMATVCSTIFSSLSHFCALTAIDLTSGIIIHSMQNRGESSVL